MPPVSPPQSGASSGPDGHERAMALLDEIMSYIDFRAEDARLIRELGPPLAPHLEQVVDQFYKAILRHPGARKVLTGPDQVNRLRQTLKHWLGTLFCGVYDDAYCRLRENIGRVHVRVGLAQHYMFSAIEVMWQEIERLVRKLAIPDGDQKLRALHKLMTIEISIMLDTYRASYVERERAFERRVMQERVSRAEHLAHIGQLAASLAHEIKNPLAGISGAIQVIRDTLPSDAPHRTVLAEVLRQVSRLDDTVKDLLVYARPAPLRLRECDVQSLFKRLLSMLAASPEAQRVQLECELPESFPTILADEGQLEQVFMNLLLNAMQASPDQGRIQVRGQRQDRRVSITVSDQGPGMSDDVKKRAFEPFFTTRARGTGLGLSICQKMVEAHGGSITIQSQPGSGAELIVELPIESTVQD